MAPLPQLLTEDMDRIEAVLKDLLSKSEAASALLLDKGGFLIVQCGDDKGFDSTTLGALAAAMYAATQGIAGLVGENSFSNIYQQGVKVSLLASDVDEHCLLLVLFDAQGSVGSVKYYTTPAISQIAQQLQIAEHRAPGEGLDLAALNVTDTADFFGRKSKTGPSEEESGNGDDESASDSRGEDPAVKLQKIKKLLQNHLITQEDFEFMKRKILQEM
jgi:predicted regulator of Ras-like GTPase activity (Roadblock/LC7/MglB family)